MTIIDERWQSLLTEFGRKSERKLIYVLGPTDSGKTTFCRFLHEHLTSKFCTACIDGDPGQSVIGPPTTVGLEFFPEIGQGKRHVCLYFVGSTSPLGHLLQTLSGLKKLTEKAIQLGATRVILDSSGFVLGKPAREFQFQVVDLLKPDHVVCLEHAEELEDLLINFRKNPGIKIHRIPISSDVPTKTPLERKQYRENRFKVYFQDSKPQELCWEEMGFHGMIPNISHPKTLCHRLIALCDWENFVVTLGIVRSAVLNGKRLLFSSPKYDQSKVASVQFGSIYLNLDGRQITTGNVTHSPNNNSVCGSRTSQ